MEYTIILAINDMELIEHVNNSMSEGWQPLGGAFVDAHGFCQTMTRACKPAKISKKMLLPPKAVINLWNEVTKDTPLPRKIKVIPALEQSIRARVNEKDGFNTIEAWRSYFTAITRSDFLTGKTPSGNWKASLEWAVKPKSIAGVIEGKYHNE